MSRHEYQPLDILSQADEMESSARHMRSLALQQQQRYFTLVDGLVKMHQAMRDTKNYAVSDALRALLNSAGVEVVQGTGAYSYNMIPLELAGRPVGDTWTDPPGRAVAERAASKKQTESHYDPHSRITRSP